MSTNGKIFLDPAALAPRVQQLRDAGQIIVFGNGCFDLLHVGHVRYLNAAKALGDVLILGVNTDESVRRNRAGQLPINPEHERYEVLAALEAVDFVVPLDAALPIPLIELFKPHIQAKGTDYNLEKMPERPAVERYGGRIEFVGDPKEHSSSALREALRGRTAEGTKACPDEGTALKSRQYAPSQPLVSTASEDKQSPGVSIRVNPMLRWPQVETS